MCYVHNQWDDISCATLYVLEGGRPQLAIWRIRIAFWINKIANTHSEHVTLIAFPLQQCTNVPQCYVIHTLPVFFSSKLTNRHHFISIVNLECVEAKL